MKFILGFKNFDLQFCIVKYRTNLTPSFYGVYKFAKSVLAILYIQAQIRDNQEQHKDKKYPSPSKYYSKIVIVFIAMLIIYHHVKPSQLSLNLCTKIWPQYLPFHLQTQHLHF